MTFRDVTRAIVGFHHENLWSPLRATVLLNASDLAGWEADILVLQPSGVLYEIEVKVSVSDFRREFKTKERKHQALRNGASEPDRWGHRGRNLHVQRYYFAFPESVYNKLKPDEFPEYAGIIVVPDEPGRGGRRQPRIIRKPKKLPMATKVTDRFRIRMLELTHARFWSYWGKSDHPVAYETVLDELQSEDASDGLPN